MHSWLVRNALFPLHERLKGHSTIEILREMEVNDTLSAEELDALACSKLQDLIRYSHTHVPYIRSRMDEMGVRPSDIQTPQDLVRLPLMKKADIRANRAQLRSDIAGKLAQYSTTGSTGDPLLFDLSKRRISSRVACRQRVTQWWGLSVGDPEFVIWGSPVELSKQDWVRGVRDRIMNTQLLSAFEMSEAVMTKYLELIVRKGCTHLFGYPSSMYLMCLGAQKRGINLRRLGVKAVFVTGEILWPHQRELISEAFNAPVADGYGGRDSGFLSHECPQGGMHILSDAVIVEVVDEKGQPVAAGESGDIVVTDLYSHEVPFIRYMTGDRGVLSSGRCRCGRALPLLEKLEGRAMDFFVTPDGRTIPGGSIFYVFYGVEGVEQFRVYQKAVDYFHIQIMAGANYTAHSESRIRDGFIRRMRSQVRVTFEYVPSFPIEKTGKFRCVISEVAEAPVIEKR